MDGERTPRLATYTHTSILSTILMYFYRKRLPPSPKISIELEFFPFTKIRHSTLNPKTAINATWNRKRESFGGKNDQPRALNKPLRVLVLFENRKSGIKKPDTDTSAITIHYLTLGGRQIINLASERS